MDKDIKLLWEELNEELYNFILKRVRHEDDAKDILQDVFLKIQLKMDTLQNPSKLTSWVYQITRNTLSDHYRGKKNSKETPFHIDLPETGEEDHVYARLSNCINGKITALSTKYKEAILMTSFKDFTQKQLAQFENISYSGAKSRVQRAKDILKGDILDCPNVVKDSDGNIIDYLK